MIIEIWIQIQEFFEGILPLQYWQWQRLLIMRAAAVRKCADQLTSDRMN